MRNKGAIPQIPAIPASPLHEWRRCRRMGWRQRSQPARPSERFHPCLYHTLIHGKPALVPQATLQPPLHVGLQALRAALRSAPCTDSAAAAGAGLALQGQPRPLAWSHCGAAG